MVSRRMDAAEMIEFENSSLRAVQQTRAIRVSGWVLFDPKADGSTWRNRRSLCSGSLGGG